MHAKRRARRLHRRIATLAVVIVLWFALSGLILNHAADIELHERMLPASLANFFYGTTLPDVLDGHVLDGRWVTVFDGMLYYDAHAVTPCNKLVGVAPFGELRAVACQDAVHLLGNTGVLTERMDAAWGLHGDIHALAVETLGVQGASLVIATGENTWCSDSALIGIAPCAVSIDATPTQRLDATARAQLAQALASPAVDVERFVNDLHSGRLFGTNARWVWDLFALLLLALAATGLRMLRKH
ncbi:MAG: PepSY-associated TM helix domain-containing protein [Pseudomonadota bacterium]